MKRLLPVMALLLGACVSDAPPPVTVYVPADLENPYTWLSKSGLPIVVVTGDSTVNSELIVAGQDSPRADVLITSGVVDVWNAAENGALRPLIGDALAGVPDSLKDPDGLWAAATSRHTIIGTAPGLETVSVIDLQKLASPELKGRVCLSSSVLEDNRALIASLIAEHGNRPAERIVRGWVRNLATAPFKSDEELVAALRSAACAYGIVSSAADTSGIRRIDLATRYYNIQGIGVARHAQNPDGAQQLVNWVLDQYSQEGPASGVLNVGEAGWYEDEARLLAERAGYW